MVLATLSDATKRLLVAVTRPGRFFAEDEQAFEPLPAVLLGFGFALFLAAAVIGLGWIMAVTVDATTVMDNPDRPPDWVCNTEGTDPDSPWYDDCREPETIERSVGPLLFDAALDRVPPILLAGMFVWPLLGVAIHAVSYAAGGSGSIGRSLSVAAFGLVPEYLHILAVLGLFAVTFDATSFEAASIEAVIDRFVATIDGLRPIIWAITGITTLWQWYIFTNGIAVAHDLHRTPAAVAGGGVALGLLLLAAI